MPLTKVSKFKIFIFPSTTKSNQVNQKKNYFSELLNSIDAIAMDTDELNKRNAVEPIFESKGVCKMSDNLDNISQKKHLYNFPYRLQK